MISPGLNQYEVILNEKYYLRELVKSISLDESLEEISLRASVSLVIGEGWPGVDPGQDIRITGIPFGGSEPVELLSGVVWTAENEFRGNDSLNLTIYDRTIYLSKSEDEYLFPAGQTASQRLKKYAADWDIRISDIPDTGVALSKAVYRARPIYKMITDDLKETVKKGGDLYRPRMTSSGLELYRLGSNQTVWVLEPGVNIEEINQHRTLDDAVTQVKVFGQQKKAARGKEEIDTSKMTLEEIGRKYGATVDAKGKVKKPELPSPVLVIEKGQTDKFGTLQRVIQDPDIKTAAEGRKAAQAMLSGVQETFTVRAIGINTIRAGDKVELVGSGLELLAISVRHELGDPGSMTLTLATWDYVRRRFFYDGSN